MNVGDYLVSSNDLYRVYEDGRSGKRLHCVLENVSGVNQDSQHGKCLADAGLFHNGQRTLKRIVAIGDRNGVTEYDANLIADMGRLPTPEGAGCTCPKWLVEVSERGERYDQPGPWHSEKCAMHVPF